MQRRCRREARTAAMVEAFGRIRLRTADPAFFLFLSRVSPKGPSSGMRMLTYFINRAGRGLTTKRRAELQKAKTLLSARIQNSRKSSPRKTA